MERERKEWSWDEAIGEFGFVKASALWQAIREKRPTSSNRRVSAYLTDGQACAIADADTAAAAGAVMRQVANYGPDGWIE